MSAFQFNLNVSGGGFYSDGAGLQDGLNVGLAIPKLDVSLSQGDSETWQQVAVALAIASGSPLDLDLTTGLTDKIGRTLNLTKLHVAILTVSTPDGVKRLQWGPTSIANAAALWFGATTGSEIVYDQSVRTTAYGWTIVPAGARKFRIANPGSGTVNGTLYLAGKQ